MSSNTVGYIHRLLWDFSPTQKFVMDVQLLTHSLFSSQMDQSVEGGKKNNVQVALHTRGKWKWANWNHGPPVAPDLKDHWCCLSGVPLVRQTYIELYCQHWHRIVIHVQCAREGRKVFPFPTGVKHALFKTVRLQLLARESLPQICPLIHQTASWEGWETIAKL